MIRNRIVGVVLSAWLSSAGLVMAAPQQTLAPDRISDITNTKHNFAALDGPTLPDGQQRDIRAVSQNETCVFCHTPHFANNVPGAPLWNRQLSSATYTPYTSSSMQASPAPGAPGGSSKLCLSCHDGTLAIGAVGVANGREMGTSVDDVDPSDGKFVGSRPSVPGNNRQVLKDTSRANPSSTPLEMQGAGANGGMPAGKGLLTGYTSNLGTDLTNDHPISFVYDQTLATQDSELFVPTPGNAIVAERVSAPKTALDPVLARPALPLEKNKKVECGTCHDPHIRGTGADEQVNVKFLRLNRFQKGQPSAGDYSLKEDINCVACHKKAGWAGSAHANRDVATHKYLDDAANLREFPRGTAVWQASCLNCHDSHTVQGARRLLREGIGGVGPVKGDTGAHPALEETCYQCHAGIATSVLQGAAQPMVDIKAAFDSTFHMPIGRYKPDGPDEAHDVINADLEERPESLGKGKPSNRHVECSDCHNPHRVTKNRLFDTDPSMPDSSGTHVHSSSSMHTNLASGSLRGAVGVEPSFTDSEFAIGKSIGFDVKKGDPSAPPVTGVVTKEYQVCLRCHSAYGSDYRPNVPVALGLRGGATASGTNGITEYTDQAMEFQAPAEHTGDQPAGGTGAGAAFAANNHRSWHPVMAPTGRSEGDQAYLQPFSHVGQQTMYCSDCHGSSSAPGTVAPSVGDSWGPHGSSHEFILKGTWSGQSGVSEGDDLCSKCHSADQYSPAITPQKIEKSGFRCPDNSCISAVGDRPMSENLHVLHKGKGGDAGRCMSCHVAVPHGFKNKALLANLNDVGPNESPYYNGAKLKVVGFKPSGQWVKADCAGCH